jgi:hypothetical protein
MQEQLKRVTDERNKAREDGKAAAPAAAKPSDVAAATQKPKGWGKLRASVLKAKSSGLLEDKPESVRRGLCKQRLPLCYRAPGRSKRAASYLRKQKPLPYRCPHRVPIASVSAGHAEVSKHL